MVWTSVETCAFRRNAIHADLLYTVALHTTEYSLSFSNKIGYIYLSDSKVTKFYPPVPLDYKQFLVFLCSRKRLK